MGGATDTPDDAIRIHNRVALFRIDRGISRRQLAAELGISYNTLGAIERQSYNPSLELAFRIANFFELPTRLVWSPRPFEPLSEILDPENRNARPDRP